MFPPELDTVVGPTCPLASVNSTNGETTRRTGSLRDALADGLGDLRQCLVGGPSDPPPTGADIQEVTFGTCKPAVEEYLGGLRDGVGFGMSYGSAEQWPAGYNIGTCMAVSDAPVTGLMGAS